MAGPTNRFDALDPRAPLAQPSIRHVGDGWENPGMLVEKADRALNLALDQRVPGELPEAVEPPTPPKPSPTMLRDRLAEAITTRQETDAAAARAQGDCDRAELHADRCRRRLAEHDDLDDAITAATVEQLRDAGRAVELGGDLRARISARDDARIELQGAERAAEQLRREFVTAGQEATNAARTVDTFVTAILAGEAEALAYRHLELLAEAAAIRASLLAANHALANRGVQLAWPVLQVLGHDISELARLQDVTPWHRAAAALRADPRAAITIDLPAPRPVMSPRPAAPVMPRLMVPSAPLPDAASE